MTDCKEESETDLELLSMLNGEESLSRKFGLTFGDDGERALSRDEVRSLNAWPFPLPSPDFDDVIP